MFVKMAFFLDSRVRVQVLRLDPGIDAGSGYPHVSKNMFVCKCFPVR